MVTSSRLPWIRWTFTLVTLNEETHGIPAGVWCVVGNTEPPLTSEEMKNFNHACLRKVPSASLQALLQAASPVISTAAFLKTRHTAWSCAVVNTAALLSLMASMVKPCGFDVLKEWVNVRPAVGRLPLVAAQPHCASAASAPISASAGQVHCADDVAAAAGHVSLAVAVQRAVSAAVERVASWTVCTTTRGVAVCTTPWRPGAPSRQPIIWIQLDYVKSGDGHTGRLSLQHDGRDTALPLQDKLLRSLKSTAPLTLHLAADVAAGDSSSSTNDSVISNSSIMWGTNAAGDADPLPARGGRDVVAVSSSLDVAPSAVAIIAAFLDTACARVCTGFAVSSDKITHVVDIVADTDDMVIERGQGQSAILTVRHERCPGLVYDGKYTRCADCSGVYDRLRHTLSNRKPSVHMTEVCTAVGSTMVVGERVANERVHMHNLVPVSLVAVH